PLEVHVPPIGIAPLIVTAWQGGVVVHAPTDGITGLPHGLEHALSEKNVITGPVHDTPAGALHVHAPHRAAGASRSALPSNTGVAPYPAPPGGAGAAPADVSRSAKGPLQPCGAADAQRRPSPHGT